LRDFSGSKARPDQNPGLTEERVNEMRDTGGDGEEERVREQSQRLKEKIARAQATHATTLAAGTKANRDMTGMSRGLRLGTEFVAAILVGAVAGYLLDQWLHTTPWIMLVLLLVGFAAGVLNVVRSAAELNRASPPPPSSDLDPGRDDDED
jgi:ATP synthase protein I